MRSIEGLTSPLLPRIFTNRPFASPNSETFHRLITGQVTFEPRMVSRMPKYERWTSDVEGPNPKKAILFSEIAWAYNPNTGYSETAKSDFGGGFDAPVPTLIVLGGS